MPRLNLFGLVSALERIGVKIQEIVVSDEEDSVFLVTKDPIRTTDKISYAGKDKDGNHKYKIKR